MDINPELFYKLENKILGRNFSVNPSDNDTIRFCLSHIVLKAIALTKDPKSDKTKVKDLFDLAAEIMAISEVKTEHEDQRLKDLINAMIDSEDVVIKINKMSSELIASVKSFEEKAMFQINLIREDVNVVETVSQENKKMLEEKSSRTNVFKVISMLIAFIAFILFTFVGGVVIIVAYLNALSQPQPSQFPSKSSLEIPKELLYRHDTWYPYTRRVDR